MHADRKLRAVSFEEDAAIGLLSQENIEPFGVDEVRVNCVARLSVVMGEPAVLGQAGEPVNFPEQELVTDLLRTLLNTVRDNVLPRFDPFF